MTTRKGPWSPDQLERFLADTRVPMRLACNGASGHPVIASLWFLSLEDRLWCATQRSARIVSHLTRDPRCAFEIAEDRPPYHGVRGQGRVRIHDERGEPILRRLIERYLGGSDSDFARWLIARAEGETALSIEPRTLLSWDYRERMEGAA
ncbi:MAG: pyridoxamine 5'-phosphate oxidase family protein [Myxococcales bacterium]|nr:pyridoxamine 5'-phosphate oxidase family protein [Myxococcales bacterium]